MKGETMVMDGQAAAVINKNAQVVKEIARLAKYKARLEKEVAQLKKDKAQRVVYQSQRVGENAILAENADGAVAEVARLRSELETLKAKLADKNAGKKRDRDEILEHHDPAPSTPYVHKKTRRAGVRHAYSVSQPNYHTEA
jgi:DNA repair exonuclease SbcCD ATPase subunit